MGASVAGEDHQAIGLPCQDAWARWKVRSRPAIAVADGMGSCPYALEGARASCIAALHALRWWQDKSQAPVEPVIRALYQRWQLEIHPLEAPSAQATCLAVAQARDGRFLAVQLGDGLVLVDGPGGHGVLKTEDDDCWVNETIALGSARSLDEWVWKVYEPDEVRGFLLATDGVANGLDEDRYGEFLVHLRDIATSQNQCERDHTLSRQLQAWPSEAAAGDDRTVACLFRLGV